MEHKNSQSLELFESEEERWSSAAPEAQEDRIK